MRLTRLFACLAAIAGLASCASLPTAAPPAATDSREAFVIAATPAAGGEEQRQRGDGERSDRPTMEADGKHHGLPGSRF